MSILYQKNRIKDLLKDDFLINVEMRSLDYPAAIAVWLTVLLE